jgi:hypothetical protein
MSDEELKAKLERLRNENAALKKEASSNIRMKVSEKGAVSIYGMGRFPVTLYKEQWVEAARHGGRDSRVHCRERRAIEGEGLNRVPGIATVSATTTDQASAHRGHRARFRSSYALLVRTCEEVAAPYFPAGSCRVSTKPPVRVPELEPRRDLFAAPSLRIDQDAHRVRKGGRRLGPLAVVQMPIVGELEF